MCVEKDVARTDRTHVFFHGDNNPNITVLYDVLLTHCMYNFDLGQFSLCMSVCLSVCLFLCLFNIAIFICTHSHMYVYTLRGREREREREREWRGGSVVCVCSDYCTL